MILEGEVLYRIRNVGPIWLPSWLRRAVTFALPWTREEVYAEIPIATGILQPLPAGFRLEIDKNYVSVRYGGVEVWRGRLGELRYRIQAEPLKGVKIDVWVTVQGG